MSKMRFFRCPCLSNFTQPSLSHAVMKSENTAAGKKMALWQSVVTVAALVVVVAGMKAAVSIVQPFLLSLFLAVIFGAPLSWLRRNGVPRWIALGLVVSGTIVTVLLATALVDKSISDFKTALPGYRQSIENRINTVLKTAEAEQGANAANPEEAEGIFPRLIAWLEERGVELKISTLTEKLQPGKAMNFVGDLLGSFQVVLANVFLILLMTVFLLSEASTFPDKLRAISRNPDATIAQANEVLGSLNQYLMMKSAISLLTGVLVVALVTACGVEYALLWGLLAFALNFVPNIGSIIAAVPPILLALVTPEGGAGTALAMAIGYLLINVVIGNVIEPRFMGRGLGLSTLVVFVSLVFWGWVLGPVGMLLSVPLTMTIKIALQNHADTQWIATLLGPPPKAP